MTAAEIMLRLSDLGNERAKKILISAGANDNVFGIAVKDLKPIYKETKNNQELAEKLFSTGNYDAMYLAGMIAEPKKMTAQDFERWIDGAYFYMVGSFIVSVTLAESPLAQQIADSWIVSGEEQKMSAGWSCYEWLLGSQKDSEFEEIKISQMLDKVRSEINAAPNWVRYSMNNFLAAVGVSYAPLHEKALSIALAIGDISIAKGKTQLVLSAAESILKAKETSRIGFKRKNVRC